VATLKTLREKYAKRAAGRKRQKRLYEKTGERGHAREAAEHGRAMRKLAALIKKKIREGLIDWNGCEPLPLSRRKTRRALRWVLSNVEGVYVTSTVRYDSETYHGPSQRRAVDLGSDDSSERPEKEAQHALLLRFGAEYFLELFGPAPWYVKNGTVYPGVFPAHGDHDHFAA
jgi:hypothetical protein